MLKLECCKRVLCNKPEGCLSLTHLPLPDSLWRALSISLSEIKVDDKGGDEEQDGALAHAAAERNLMFLALSDIRHKA